jgi:hypothetical protein
MEGPSVVLSRFKRTHGADVPGKDAAEIVADTDEEAFVVRQVQLPARLGEELRRRAAPARHDVGFGVGKGGKDSFA